MKNINIGILVPNSSILPIGKFFEKGLKAGLAPCADMGIGVELINEFAGQSGIRQINDIIDRFLNYHEVDIVTGIISNHVAADVADKFEKKQIPLLINNLGEHIPNVNKLNPYVFINSPHLWRHAWSLGHYGVKNLGEKGMYVSAVYDAGYGFSQMFSMGMMAADPQSEWSFAVAPMPPIGSLTDMATIFPYIESNKPDFIFATFCGTETTLFLNEFISRGLHKYIKLVGLPYLTTPFEPIGDDMQIISTLPCTQQTESGLDKIFYELGYQTGQIIADVAPLANTTADLQQQLQTLNKLFSVAAGNTLNEYTTDTQVTITQNAITNNGQQCIVTEVQQYPTFNIEYRLLEELVSDVSFGWLNPYLCI